METIETGPATEPEGPGKTGENSKKKKFCADAGVAKITFFPFTLHMWQLVFVVEFFHMAGL